MQPNESNAGKNTGGQNRGSNQGSNTGSNIPRTGGSNPNQPNRPDQGGDWKKNRDPAQTPGGTPGMPGGSGQRPNDPSRTGSANRDIDESDDDMSKEKENRQNQGDKYETQAP